MFVIWTYLDGFYYTFNHIWIAFFAGHLNSYLVWQKQYVMKCDLNVILNKCKHILLSRHVRFRYPDDVKGFPVFIQSGVMCNRKRVFTWNLWREEFSSLAYLSVWAPDTCLFSKAENDSQNLCLPRLSDSGMCAQLCRVEFTVMAPSTVTTLIRPLFLRRHVVFYISNLNSLIVGTHI